VVSFTEKYNNSNQIIIVGVVLGLIIILLLAYAGYATYLIRGYKVKGTRIITQLYCFENNRKC
jgi:hypothetical protein